MFAYASKQVVVMNSCDPSDGILTCNDGDPSCDYKSVTDPIVLEGGVRTLYESFAWRFGVEDHVCHFDARNHT